MYLLMLWLPLFSFFLLMSCGRFLGIQGAMRVVVVNMFLSFLVALYCFFEVSLNGAVCVYNLFTWVNIGRCVIDWIFFYDGLTAVMCVVVTFISFLVHFYSCDYMRYDPHLVRFLAYLSFFSFCMLFSISAGNFLVMFVGWEGVGITSYMLINFFCTRVQANKSALKAVLLNRVGDFGFLMALCCMVYVFRSVDYNFIFSVCFLYDAVFLNIFFFTFRAVDVVAFFILVAAVGKSAQFGLHTWLPDAMEGPTPVSALLHAATMVTLGVFLLLRSSFLFEVSNNVLFLVSLIGALTAFFAATVGVFQNDLKKVIAYSTCSQLGYMFFSCGLSNYSGSMFHLTNHAFFKALLFLSAGSVIHALLDEQDMRKMGGLVQLMPFTYVVMFFGSLSLMGFPFLTGFYSKDFLLEYAFAFSRYNVSGSFVLWLGFLSALFTSFYSIRLIILTFLVRFNGYRLSVKKIYDASFIMMVVFVVLVWCSVFVGYLLKDMFIGLGTDFWGNSFFINLSRVHLHFEAECVPGFIKLLPIFFTLVGIELSFLVNYFFVSCFYVYCMRLVSWVEMYAYSFTNIELLFFFFQNFVMFFSKKWFLDKLYNEWVARVLLRSGYKFTFLGLDRGVLEKAGPAGVALLYCYVSRFFVRFFEKNSLFFCLGFMFFALNGILFFLLVEFVIVG